MFLPELGIEVQDVTILPETAFGAARDFVELQGVVEPAPSWRIRDLAGGRVLLRIQPLEDARTHPVGFLFTGIR